MIGGRRVVLYFEIKKIRDKVMNDKIKQNCNIPLSFRLKIRKTDFYTYKHTHKNIKTHAYLLLWECVMNITRRIYEY